MTKSEKLILAGFILSVVGMAYWNFSENKEIRAKLKAAQSALVEAREEITFETTSRFTCLDYLETEIHDHAVTLALAIAALDLVDWELSQSAQVCEAVN